MECLRFLMTNVEQQRELLEKKEKKNSVEPQTSVYLSVDVGMRKHKA